MTRTLNQGRNALTDALVAGKDVTVTDVAVGRDGSAFSESQTGLQDAISGAQYATTNRRRATGSGRYNATIPASDVTDGETLEELTVIIDDGGSDLTIARIPFAETPKSNGSELKVEVESEVSN